MINPSQRQRVRSALITWSSCSPRDPQPFLFFYGRAGYGSLPKSRRKRAFHLVMDEVFMLGVVTQIYRYKMHSKSFRNQRTEAHSLIKYVQHCSETETRCQASCTYRNLWAALRVPAEHWWLAEGASSLWLQTALSPSQTCESKALCARVIGNNCCYGCKQWLSDSMAYTRNQCCPALATCTLVN